MCQPEEKWCEEGNEPAITNGGLHVEPLGDDLRLVCVQREELVTQAEVANGTIPNRGFEIAHFSLCNPSADLAGHWFKNHDQHCVHISFD